MTVTYDRDHAHGRAVITLSGAFDLEQTLAIVDHLAGDSIWEYCMLYDTGGLTSAPTMRDLQRIVDRVQVVALRRPRGPIAIVAPDQALSGISRMSASRLEGLVLIEVFQSMSEGRSWLERTSVEAAALPRR